MRRTLQALAGAGVCLFWSSLAVAQEGVPVCLNLSDKVAENLQNAVGAIAVVMAALKPLSWMIGSVAGKMEDGSENPKVKMIAKSLSYMAWFVGLFTFGNVPGSVKHQITLPLEKKKQALPEQPAA